MEKIHNTISTAHSLSGHELSLTMLSCLLGIDRPFNLLIEAGLLEKQGCHYQCCRRVTNDSCSLWQPCSAAVSRPQDSNQDQSWVRDSLESEKKYRPLFMGNDIRSKRTPQLKQVLNHTVTTDPVYVRSVFTQGK